MSRISNARRSRFSCRLESARASRTNFVAARPGASAPTVADDTGTTSTLHRPYDKTAPDPRWMRRRGTAPDEAPPPARAPRLELRGTDRPGGGAADRSSVVGVVARASSRTR